MKHQEEPAVDARGLVDGECRDLVGNDSRSRVVIPEMSEVAMFAPCVLDAAKSRSQRTDNPLSLSGW